MRRVPAGPAALVCAALFLAAGCGEDLAARSGLENARSSDRAVIQAALDALAAGDRTAMEALLLTREEHRTLVWDSLPERHTFSFDYVRLLTERNTGKAISRALERYAGQRFELLDVTYEKGREVYGDVTLHRDANITVRRLDDGQEGTIPLVDVLFERNGGWKLMNYVE
ncbi:MAG: hypothetical protein RRA92_03825 [Gemmatimonadota bacterium]|nr:hypothetical protein [Gemmatimonadota bacterium]